MRQEGRAVCGFVVVEWNLLPCFDEKVFLCVSVSGVLILMGSRDGKVRTMLIYVCEMDLLY